MLASQGQSKSQRVFAAEACGAGAGTLRALSVAGGFVVFGLLIPSLGAVATPPSVVASRAASVLDRESIADSLVVLRMAAMDELSRARAVARLLSSIDPSPGASDSEQRRTVAGMLNAPSMDGGWIDAGDNSPLNITDDHPTEAELILAGIAQLPDAPAWLFDPVVGRLERAEGEDISRILAALGSFRTSRAAMLILQYTTLDQEAVIRRSSKATSSSFGRDSVAIAERIRASAFAALERSIGRDDLSRDSQAWSRFIEELQRNDPDGASWSARIAPYLAARADHMERDRALALERAVESLRRLHLLVSDEERDAFLASALADSLGPVRRLGFELANRELGAGRQLGPAVLDSAVALLADPDASTRAAAALLLKQMGPGADSAAARALVHAANAEQDPRAAAAMLSSLSRWPQGPMAPVAITWIDANAIRSWFSVEGSVRDAAITLGAALIRAGAVNSEAREELIAAVRRVPDQQLSSEAVWILSRSGDERDRRRLSDLLGEILPQARGDGETGDRDAQRISSIVRALIAYPDSLPTVLDAAGREPDLFAAAAEATLLHDPTASGYMRLRSLRAPSPQVRRDGLQMVAARLPATELLRMASSTAMDATESDELFRQLFAAERILYERASPEAAAAIVSGAVTWVRGQLQQALTNRAALDAIPPVLDAIKPLAAEVIGPASRLPEVHELETLTLLGLERVELAEEITGVSLDVWMEGLRRSTDGPAAAAVAGAILRRFSATLSPEQREQLASAMKPRDGG